MAKINRRSLLMSVGLAGPAAMLSGRSDASDELSAPGDSPAIRRDEWKYVRLDPAAVGERAYRIYPEGGCMYAVVGSVIGALADGVGEPFRSFPFEMMRFGDGGVGGWGSLCGVVNGGSSLIGLFHGEKSKQTREELIADFCTWYETAELPTYEPAEPQWADEAEPSVSGSVLCHVSTAKWCETSGAEAFSMEKKERCRRLAADGAMKIARILNRKVEYPEHKFAELTPDVKACIDCHGKRELADAMGKMSCHACHTFDKEHP